MYETDQRKLQDFGKRSGEEKSVHYILLLFGWSVLVQNMFH